MIASWQQGREQVDQLIGRGELERVSADKNLSVLLLSQAEGHLVASKATASIDAAGSFQLAYDSARKALAAVLQAEGIRPTSRGGHVALIETFRAQFVPPLEALANGFGWMRRLRNSTEYPSMDQPIATADDLQNAQEIASEAITKARVLVDTVPVY